MGRNGGRRGQEDLRVGGISGLRGCAGTDVYKLATAEVRTSAEVERTATWLARYEHSVNCECPWRTNTVYQPRAIPSGARVDISGRNPNWRKVRIRDGGARHAPSVNRHEGLVPRGRKNACREVVDLYPARRLSRHWVQPRKRSAIRKSADGSEESACGSLQMKLPWLSP